MNWMPQHWLHWSVQSNGNECSGQLRFGTQTNLRLTDAFNWCSVQTTKHYLASSICFGSSLNMPLIFWLIMGKQMSSWKWDSNEKPTEWQQYINRASENKMEREKEKEKCNRKANNSINRVCKYQLNLLLIVNRFETSVRARASDAFTASA